MILIFQRQIRPKHTIFTLSRLDKFAFDLLFKINLSLPEYKALSRRVIK